MWERVRSELAKRFEGTNYEAWYMWSMPMCCGSVCGIRIVDRETNIKIAAEVEKNGCFTVTGERIKLDLLGIISEALKEGEFYEV